jgi:hypothetical protein
MNRASNMLPESPVSLALGDVVPHITIQSLHLRVGEFESHLAKRLLQQYRHEADIPKYLGNVRYWVNSGKHLLTLSFSGFDPGRI